MTPSRSNSSRQMRHVSSSPGSSITAHLAPLLLLLDALILAGAQPAAGRDQSRRHGAQPFTASMVILVVILLAAFFLVAFVSAYLRFCVGGERSGDSLSLRLRPRSVERHASCGIEPAVIKSFPVVAYSEVKGVKLGCEPLQCSICIHEFRDDDDLRLLPCSHVFHPVCIDPWLESRVTCPVCRSDLGFPSPAPTPAPNAPPIAETPETEDETALHAVHADSAEERNEELQPDLLDPTSVPTSMPIRPKSTRRGLGFLRSHTTGHSIVQQAENLDRFTLRLPDHVRKEIMDRILNRSASCAALRTGDRPISAGKVDQRFQNAGEGMEDEESGGGVHCLLQRRYSKRAAKSDRYTLLTASSFFARTFSLRPQRRAESELIADRSCLPVFPTVRSLSDRLGRKGEAPVPATDARSQIPVFTVSTQ